jgi:cytochrome c2
LTAEGFCSDQEAMKLSAIVVAAAFSVTPQLVNAQDAAAGEKAFVRCTACHSVGEGAANRMGPQLNGIVGKQAGTQEGYNYSSATTAAGEAGMTWTPENLASFLKRPRDFLPGNKMTFSGVPDDQAIADIVAYLTTFSPDYVPAGAAAQ